MKKVTITDVAKHAGVSMKSVSRVINAEPNVGAALRERVMTAVHDLGYRPNLAARSLAAGRSFVIGVLFDNPSPNYTMKVQEGIYAACKRAGYQLVIEHVDTGGSDVAGAMDAMLTNRRLDGLVVTPPITDSDQTLCAIEAHHVAYVRLSPGRFPGRSSAVATNDSAGAEDVVEHLWALGHRHFGIANGPPAHAAANWRRQGFLAALARHGVAEGEIVEAEGNFTFPSGIAAGLALLCRDQPPTAIFATNDDMAAGVFAAAAQLGIRIPDQLSVVGFDDSWIAESVWPALTTVHQPIAEMAQVAADMLIAGRGSATDSRIAHLDCRMILRGSTAPATR
ncbi:LacI family DNA-binding transcriptional regulator [Sphingobium aquiterrae]|uniref:LacI family DNA-binding transcriptional regulator n=1 Tax=Sphingobium aquiterrae TaxID=2038656 RepID=UPI00301B4CA2